MTRSRTLADVEDGPPAPPTQYRRRFTATAAWVAGNQRAAVGVRDEDRLGGKLEGIERRLIATVRNVDGSPVPRASSAEEDESGPYVAMIFWEKGADLYRWDGAEFSLSYDPDACC